MFVPLCKYLKNWIIYLKQVELMIYKLYLNKAVKQEKINNPTTKFSLPTTSPLFSHSTAPHCHLLDSWFLDPYIQLPSCLPLPSSTTDDSQEAQLDLRSPLTYQVFTLPSITTASVQTQLPPLLTTRNSHSQTSSGLPNRRWRFRHYT